ncbi:hypothetical protein LV164_002836 [Aspergillus fumigatus]|nr:hypothetical protein KXX42_008806 [Aspergillus fumigatus]KAH1551895.1 hypothetical protein KXX57_008179 [Aspergillus fumigatus]KAH1986109.1 hypothetical protein KXW88_007982 [Aspergillus fumigatus]KAH2317564.1 hypothetical protein KXV47_008603 [Aspergillus fumigatus]KAH2664828.1 hypothetical protein KXV32_007657 [Aspergillus fumigatus]
MLMMTDSFVTSRRHPVRRFQATHPRSFLTERLLRAIPGVLLSQGRGFFSGRFWDHKERSLAKASARPTSRQQIQPTPMRADIDAMNEWVDGKMHKWVYNAGYATS